MTLSNPIEAPRTSEAKKETHFLWRYFKILGPGLITGAADDDPSGIVTYSQAGAQFGFAPLWTAVITFPLMTAVQYICGKIGLVTGTGLTSVMKKVFPGWIVLIAVFTLLATNILNAAADLAAVASGIELLVPSLPAIVRVIPITILIVTTLIFSTYDRIASLLKWLTLSLFAYIAVAFFTNPPAQEIISATLIPRIEWSKEYLGILVAILGTTISPYLFFWQASLEVEEQKNAGRTYKERRGATRDDKRFAFIDILSGCVFSNVVMFFIIAATGATLGQKQGQTIETAAQAATALKPFAGDFAFALFAVAIISTGLLAIPVLVGSASFALAELFSWPRGLNKDPYKAKEFYSAIAISCLLAMALDLAKIDPIQALIWSAILNGFLAPPLLVLILIIANNKNVMKEHTNSKLTNILGWSAATLMFVCALALLFVN